MGGGAGLGFGASKSSADLDGKPRPRITPAGRSERSPAPTLKWGRAQMTQPSTFNNRPRKTSKNQ